MCVSGGLWKVTSSGKVWVWPLLALSHGTGPFVSLRLCGINGIFEGLESNVEVEEKETEEENHFLGPVLPLAQNMALDKSLPLSGLFPLLDHERKA